MTDADREIVERLRSHAPVAGYPVSWRLVKAHELQEAADLISRLSQENEGLRTCGQHGIELLENGYDTEALSHLCRGFGDKESAVRVSEEGMK